MATHDELAYAIALETVGLIRESSPPWVELFSPDCHVTSSRQWPLPDFVLADETNKLSVAAEFKPPGQSKREYLTGLGQAIAYTRDFDYGLLVVPEISDDGYKIAEHITSVLEQDEYADVPVGVLRYDPTTITADKAGAAVARFFQRRGRAPKQRAKLEGSFYAKWREISAEEVGAFLRHLYKEKVEPTGTIGSTRDRAWERVWADIQQGTLHNWTGKKRTFANNAKSKEANYKNWRNFLTHIGWVEADGSLTEDGLRAHHASIVYGPRSRMFVNALARSVLLAGKHLILLNVINSYQDSQLTIKPFASEGAWLQGIEQHLEDKGLLKRNPERHLAAKQDETRGFLKAEKQLWKELGFLISRGRYVYHPGRGFVIDWSRITELLRA